ncbi:uroporphyrinogen-III synthase [Phorcysia thermohydrogeniphila]|uniref:Uroporphyrinogen-III synthase n=1 Tax=Phorcysia thermohydrogeniphila TaxID=936138 RepID=A0A4R1GBR3_9BACT|nr:uroporphyrinogen-III synthase [Phorcysia thermohydrogeniphila]TCK05228.1 uroporphyrinogen-III synthase [Phorcysia thermohydrogeniphila]
MRVFISAEVSREQEERLKKAGFSVTAFPLIKTSPLPFEPEEAYRFNPDFVVISSKNGVKHFFSRVSPSEFKNAKFIAVGSSTSQKLRELGIEPLIPENFSGEGVIELLKTLDLKGKRFLIVRPKVARKLVSEFLSEQGAVVKELLVYETVPDSSRKEQLQREIQNGFEVLAFTSPSNFKAFLELLGDSSEELLRRAKLIPIGHVTAKAIEKRGFKVFKIPSTYTLDGIVELIISELKTN